LTAEGEGKKKREGVDSHQEREKAPRRTLTRLNRKRERGKSV